MGLISRLILFISGRCKSSVPAKSSNAMIARLGAVVCPVCNMVYTTGDKADMAKHKRYHNQFLDGVPVSRIDKRNCFEENGKTIICVDETSKPNLQDLVHRAIQRAADDLGDAPPMPPHWKCYLMQVKTSAVGFVLIENNVNSYISSNPQKIIPSKLGVLRMWVAAKHRRTGVATTLLDAARHHEVDTVAKVAVAFSEPTDAGLAFARKYCGVEPLVFDITL